MQLCHPLRLIGFALAASIHAVAGPQSAGAPAGPGGSTGLNLHAPEGGAVAICDQTAMITNGTYTAGNGNAISGTGIFAAIFDLQMADDCVLPSATEITEVCGGFVTFLGISPTTGVWVQVYADAGGSPANVASYQVQVTNQADYSSTAFVDPVFTLIGQVICADLTTYGLELPAGTWWFDIQPIDTTPAGDWYYQLRDENVAPTGGDTHGKDGATEHGGAFGGPYGGGYGFTAWTPFASIQGSFAGDSAFRVAGVGTASSILAIPALDKAGLAVLLISLSVAAIVLLRRRG